METAQGHQVVFGPFCVDLTTHQLWRGEQAVTLQPKPLAVLHYLVQLPVNKGWKTVTRGF